MRRVSKHPAINLVLGLGMLMSGVDELIEAVDPAYKTLLELHHAVILFGLIYLLHGFVELVERLEASRVFADAGDQQP